MPCSTDNEITSAGVTHLRPKPFGFPFLFSNSNGRIQVVIWATTQQNPTEPKTPAIAAHQQPRCVLLRHFAVPVAPWLLVWPIQWSPGNDCRWDRPISKVCLASHGPLHQAHELMGWIWIHAVPQKTSVLTSEGFQNSPKYSNLPFFKGQIRPVSNPMPWLGKALSPASWRWPCMAWCWRGSIPSYSTLAQR